MLDLQIKQLGFNQSNAVMLEEFKVGLVKLLNSFQQVDSTTDRWVLTKVSEGDVASLIYDERPVAAFQTSTQGLRFWSDQSYLERFDEMLYCARGIAEQLDLCVYANNYSGAKLPRDPEISPDHSFFQRDQRYVDFFAKSEYQLRFCKQVYSYYTDETRVNLYAPYFLQEKSTGAIHICNVSMLNFLIQKENQQYNDEFCYKVADSMDDFAKKIDVGLIPLSFYQYYKKPIKIINDTNFNHLNISRKVFIDPYVWDFSTENDYKFFQNINNGLHYMDKVRHNETLNDAIKRVLHEELKLSGDYVGARIFDTEFDRDKEGLLTPRLKINVFVDGLSQKHHSQSHDWVSIK